MAIATGSSSYSTTGAFSIHSADAASGGASGAVVVGTGTTASGASGALAVETGAATGGRGGAISVLVGSSTSGSPVMLLSAGDTSDASTAGGVVQVTGGRALAGSGGSVVIGSGASISAGSGSVTVVTANVESSGVSGSGWLACFVPQI